MGHHRSRRKLKQMVPVPSPPQSPRVIQPLPQLPSKDNQIQSVQVQQFSGPLPHPDMLRQYNDYVPGSADRIIAMAEQQQEHRQALEKTVVGSNTRNERLGQWFAFVIFLVVIVASTFLISIGKGISGMSTLIGATATYATLFVYSKREKQKELAKKRIEPGPSEKQEQR